MTKPETNPPPTFPRAFVRDHCPQVIEARQWHERLGVPLDDEEAAGYAKCAFRPAGCGMECQECRLFLTRPFCGKELDAEWLPQIEAYYRQLEAWEINDPIPEGMGLRGQPFRPC